MKKLVVMVLALLMVFMSAAIAEEIPFSEWLAGQDSVVTDVFAEEAPALETPAPESHAPEAPVPEAPTFEPIGIGSRGETVAQLQAKLIELGILDSKADGVFGPASEAAVKYTQKALGWEETGVIQTEDELNTILALVPGDGVNLAMGTSQSVTLIPSGESPWCSPVGFYPTSFNGLQQLSNPTITMFTITFDWVISGADTDVDACICLKHTETTYAPVGYFHIVPGDSKGHFTGTFVPTEAMRSFGFDWIISGMGEGQVNRNIKVGIANFKFEEGVVATDWSIAPEDQGDGVNIAQGTSEIVLVTPSGEEEWCLPSFYSTSVKGLSLLSNSANVLFTVSFDWSIVGADTDVDACICLKDTETAYAPVGYFHIAPGDSTGHYCGAFVPSDGMRSFGDSWIISCVGKGSVNRNINVSLSNFKFEIGSIPTNWTMAPEDGGEQS